MGELSEKEKEVLDFLLEFVSMEIFSIEQQERDLGRLDYSLCSDDNEKQIITTKKVQKFKKRISNCNPIIAGYLNALTTPDPFNTEFEELRDSITKNFLLTEYYELFEVLVNSDLKEFERYKFESIIKSLGYKYKPLKDFIQGVCDINSYFTYKSFLDIPNDTNLSYEKVVQKLNDAFFKLEAFMIGNLKDYRHFDFNTAFTELFYFTRKAENYTYDNCKRVGQYWGLTEQIRVDYDKANFDNVKAYENKPFCNDCNVITSIAWDRIEEFNSFQTPDEVKDQTKKKSISDIMGLTIQNPKVIYIDKPNQEPFSKLDITKSLPVDKTDIVFIDQLFSKNEDILPESIINAYREIGEFKYLYINENDGEILSSYDLGPFDSLQGETIIEYFCLEKNYLNLLSKIEDKTYIFFDNLPLDMYLYEYAKGFQKAYNEFEKNLNQKQITLEEPQEQKVLKIFSYVLNAKYKNGYFGDLSETHEAIKNLKRMYVSNDLFLEWGYQGGQFYKAWEIILNNPIMFEPLFIKYSDSFTNNEIVPPKSLVNNNEVIEQGEQKEEEPVTLENPYPRIFTTSKAFNKFKNLVEEFGNGNENLANYSFVYHRMKRDNLIFDDYQQTQFMYFLLDFDINIKRIKPKTQLGNNDLRESIYNRV